MTMSKLTQEEIVEKMNSLTPSYFSIPGGKYADYTITLEDGTIYPQAVARLLHANDEHAAKGGTLDVEVKNIQYATQIINGQETPIAIIMVRVTSSLYGVRENIMTAILDTNATSDKISSTHPIEKAITQAVGRALAMYGFAFTGVLVSEEEIYESEVRSKKLGKNNVKQSQTQNGGVLSVLKNAVAEKGNDWDEFLSNNGVSEEELESNRQLLFKLLGDVKRG